MDNLYWVKDETGKRVKFVRNEAQRAMFDGAHTFNLVLKARQIGSTTYWCLYYLDEVLFNNNQKTVIIAETRNLAGEIFRDKIKFAYDNLDESLRLSLKASMDTAQQLVFSNGSSISVAVTARSETVQNLLITEFGPICYKYPERANEIVTGSLQAVHAGMNATIESTAKGIDGHFADIAKRAMEHQRRGLELSPLDFKFFFFPWWQDEKYRIEQSTVLSVELQKYFAELQAKNGIVVTDQQKWWYARKRATLGDDMFSEFPSTPDEAFRASVEGAYYGRQMDCLFAEKRLTAVPWEPTILCDTWWDLGMNDKMVILVTQQVGNQVRFIDCIHGEGEGLAYYAKLLREKPYVYRLHWGPHDLEVRELGTGKSRREVAASLGINFNVVPNLSIEDGIEAVRNLLSKVVIDEEKCGIVAKALTSYRKDWDDSMGVWKNHPRHDWASDFADAVRYLAVGNMGIETKAPYIDTRGEPKAEWVGIPGLDEADMDRYDRHGLFPRVD